MPERLEVDCEQLAELVHKLHPDTTVRDLTDKERELVFPSVRPSPEALRLSERLLREKGGALEGALQLPSLYLPKDLTMLKLSTLFEINCGED